MNPRHVILGTAGHIDHGKTALVRALTGVDTDRLKEEKARGITIELGFAELAREDGASLGVVDVPGHEAFVRAMVAGATGMDLVLLVVAADEGVMPQTREHLSVVELLDVPEMVVALTKTDLVETEWLELVADEVRDLLAPTRYADAPLVPTSVDGPGLAELADRLGQAADRSRGRRTDDVARLPVDRVFTVQGTGTVVTGTLWSGTLRVGQTVRVLPGGPDARIRGLQVHGRDVPVAEAGARTAVALTGAGADRHRLERGATLVADPDWSASRMLTVRARVLPDSGWRLEHNQRLHVGLGTQEVLARCAVLDGDALDAGDAGWIQLRLEEPAVARTGDRLILRSYSPVTTLGGGRVAETQPPKRRTLDDATRRALDAILDGTAAHRVEACLALAGWRGVAEGALPLATGLAAPEASHGLDHCVAEGAVRVAGRAFGAGVVRDADRRLADALQAAHAADPLRARVPVASLRSALPSWAGAGLADARLGALAADGALDIEQGGVRSRGHEVALSADQRAASERLEDIYRDAGLAPPDVGALPPDLAGRADLEPLLRHLEAQGRLALLDDGVWIDAGALAGAGDAVVRELGGRSGLGPADFREVLPVTRKHLIPLLAHLDRIGVTLRGTDGRDVAPPAPASADP